MIPYTRTKHAIRHFYVYTPPDSFNHGQQLVPRLTETLECPLFNPGNRVDPEAWSFTKTITDYGDAKLFNIGANGAYTDIVGSNASLCEAFAAPPDSQMLRVYNDAIGKLGEQIRGSLDLSVDAFQYKQAVKMVKEVKQLVKVWRSFKPSELHNRWLEYQYGWKPIVQSIHGLATEAVTPPKDGMIKLMARANAVDQRVEVVRHKQPGQLIEEFGQSTSIATLKERVQVGGWVILEPSALSQLARISSLNPASIAWELLPYSFVIDWVVDIGGYLRAAETACLYSSKFVRGYVSYGSELKREDRWNYGYWGKGSYSISSGFQSQTRRTFTRTPTSSFPFPVIPQVKAMLGSNRLISAAALMMQHQPKPHRRNASR